MKLVLVKWSNMEKLYELLIARSFLSTMRAWLLGEEGFDTVKRVVIRGR